MDSVWFLGRQTQTHKQGGLQSKRLKRPRVREETYFTELVQVRNQKNKIKNSGTNNICEVHEWERDQNRVATIYYLKCPVFRKKNYEADTKN